LDSSLPISGGDFICKECEALAVNNLMQLHYCEEESDVVDPHLAM
jgi:hypothetical protein